MKNRTRSSVLNLAFGTINQIISMLLNFLSRTIFIQTLGVGYLGINGLFADILMLLSLAELGLRTSMAYTFYKPLAEGDAVKVALLTQFYRKVYHTIAIFVTIVGISLVPFLDYLVNLDDAIPYLKVYYLFFLGDIVASYFFVYKTSVIEADQKKYVITKYQMYVNVVKISLQILVLLLTQNYFLYLTLQIASTLINNLLISKKATQLYPMIKERQGKLAPLERNNIFVNMRSMFIFKMSTTLMKGTDNILMSVLFGTIWVGIYSNYYLVITSLENFVSVIYMSITASLGNVVAMEKPAKRLEIFGLTHTVSLMLTTFTTVCLALLLNDFIYVWLGEKFVISTLFLSATMVNFYLKMVTYPVQSFRQATGLYIQTRYVMLLAAILNLILSVVLAKMIGISGILFASALSQLLTYFWYEPRLLFQQYFEKGTLEYFLSIMKNFLITIFLIGALVLLLQTFAIETWFYFFIKAFLVAAVSIIFIFLTYNRQDEFKKLVDRLKQLIKKSI